MKVIQFRGPFNAGTTILLSNLIPDIKGDIQIKAIGIEYPFGMPAYTEYTFNKERDILALNEEDFSYMAYTDTPELENSGIEISGTLSDSYLILPYGADKNIYIGAEWLTKINQKSDFIHPTWIYINENDEDTFYTTEAPYWVKEGFDGYINPYEKSYSQRFISTREHKDPFWLEPDYLVDTVYGIEHRHLDKQECPLISVHEANKDGVEGKLLFNIYHDFYRKKIVNFQPFPLTKSEQKNIDEDGSYQTRMSSKYKNFLFHFHSALPFGTIVTVEYAFFDKEKNIELNNEEA